MILSELEVKCILSCFLIATAFIIHSLASEILMQTKETMQEFKQTAKTITVTITKESN